MVPWIPSHVFNPNYSNGLPVSRTDYVAREIHLDQVFGSDSEWQLVQLEGAEE